MTILDVGDTRRINQPTDSDIQAGIAALRSGQSALIRVIRDDQQHYFTQAARLQPDMFLLEYRDMYGHMAADEPLSSEELTAVLTAYASGDDTWFKRFAWAPVEL